MKVLVSPVVIDYLENVSYIFYEKGYFGFYETACDYTDKILDFIYYELPSESKKVAPKYFNKFGKNMHYATYRPNKHTTWYIFYNYKDNRYIVRYITNNHVSGQHIKGL